MPRVFRKETLAFSVERWRAHAFAGLEIPPDLLQHTIQKLREKLDAKTTKFFAHQGEVVQQVNVEDHSTQLTAIDTVLSMAGAYVKESDKRPATPAVAIIVDPISGVVRLEIGGDLVSAEDQEEESAKETILDVTPVEPVALPAVEPTPENVAADPVVAEEEPQIIRVKKGMLPSEVYKALFGHGGE